MNKNKLDDVVDFKLDEGIFENSVQYYFTDLWGKYDYISDLMTKNLEDKFKKEFRPIFIIPNKLNKFCDKQNFVIINHELKKLVNKNKIIDIGDEDLNYSFSNSNFVKELIDKLSKKQDIICLYMFSSSFLNLNHPKIKILGSDPKITTKIEFKHNQIKIFEDLNLPIVKTQLIKDTNNLKKNLKILMPFVISETVNSSGYGKSLINNQDELDLFCTDLSDKIKNNYFIISEYIPDVLLSPNVNVFISNNEIKILNITDQILNKFIYFGNIYPSKITDKQKNVIINITIKIGKYLQNEGFRGLFGCDFIINKNGNVYIVEINPRRQSGYIILAILNKDLIKYELELFLDNSLSFNFNNFNFSPNFCWAHSKIRKLSIKNSLIKKVIKFNKIEHPFKNVGSEFYISFYPKNYKIEDCYLGYFLVTGKNYDKVFRNITNRTEILAKQIAL